jgi:hypothetical protein
MQGRGLLRPFSYPGAGEKNANNNNKQHPFHVMYSPLLKIPPIPSLPKGNYC